MKRILSLILASVMAVSLCACAWGSDINKPVEFYYQQTPPDSNSMVPVIASETREASGHERDLRYLLSLYLRGPLNPDLKAPFPTSCRLVDVSIDGDSLCVTLDSAFASLKGISLTIGCACIAKTCFTLADVTQVRIISTAPEDAESVDMTIGIDSLLLEDISTLSQQPDSEEP